MKDKDYVIGIDPSLTRTGVSYMLNDTMVTQALVTKGSNGVKRLFALRKELCDVIEPHLHFPTLCVVEGYSMGMGGRQIGRYFDIGELGGMIKMLLYEYGIDTVIVPPKTLKVFATGNGNAKKEEMVDACNEQWGTDFSYKQSDECDSFCLWKYGEYLINPRRIRGLAPKIADSLTKYSKLV